MQRDSGCVAICNWYLPPGNSIEEVDSLRQELEEISDVADTLIICGDLNVHHTSWLQYSNGDTARGRSLKDVCDSHGLREMVGRPIRGLYLLDLVLCSHANVKINLGPKFADHSSVLVKVPDAVETRNLSTRTA